jgi:hypothetical protein
MGKVVVDDIEYHVQKINSQEIRLVPNYLIVTVPTELPINLLEKFNFKDEKVLIYKDLFSNDYLKEALTEAIVEGRDNEVYTYSLVRHGSIEHGFGFYPLPLLFSDEFTRAVTAEENDRTPPPNVWVKRKRKIILRKLGLDDDAFNPVRKKQVPGVGWVSVRRLYK